MADNDAVHGTISINGATVKVVLPQNFANAVTQTPTGATLVLANIDIKQDVAARALEITEIVENVLQDFSAVELFGLQRVSPKFRDVISGYKVFRKRMWLEASEATASAQLFGTDTMITRESDRFRAFMHSAWFRDTTWPLRFQYERYGIKVQIDNRIFPATDLEWQQFRQTSRSDGQPLRKFTDGSWKHVILPMRARRVEMALAHAIGLRQNQHLPGVILMARGGPIVTLGYAFEAACSTAEWWYEHHDEVWMVLTNVLEGRGLLPDSLELRKMAPVVERWGPRDYLRFWLSEYAPR